jgi:hypothetical protein
MSRRVTLSVNQSARAGVKASMEGQMNPGPNARCGCGNVNQRQSEIAAVRTGALFVVCLADARSRLFMSVKTDNTTRAPTEQRSAHAEARAPAERVAPLSKDTLKGTRDRAELIEGGKGCSGPYRGRRLARDVPPESYRQIFLTKSCFVYFTKKPL